VLGVPVVRAATAETTALGAAYLAGLAVGYWNSLEEIEKQWKVDRLFEPGQKNNTPEMIAGWQRAVKAARAWAEA